MPLPHPLNGADVAVFDAYGTLLDVNSAVQHHAAQIGPGAESLSAMWRVKQLEYSWVLALCGRYVPFWTLTERALDYALAQHAGVDASLRPALLKAYEALDAYEDASRTLETLRKAGIRTAILSNADTKMLDAAVRAAALQDKLDAVLSVDPAGAFKTSPRAYDLVPERFDVDKGKVVFVSSNRWDVAGAAAYGFTPVWINRKGLPNEYPEQAPALVVDRLDKLLG